MHGSTVSIRAWAAPRAQQTRAPQTASGVAHVWHTDCNFAHPEQGLIAHRWRNLAYLVRCRLRRGHTHPQH